MITVRNAKLKDVKAIAMLNYELMMHVGKYDKIFKMCKNPLPMMEEWRRKGVYNPRHKLMVAEDNGKIVGYINAFTKTRPSIYEVKEPFAMSGKFDERNGPRDSASTAHQRA